MNTNMNNNNNKNNNLTTTTVHGRICHIFRNGTQNTNKAQNTQPSPLPIFYWGVGGEGGASVMTVVSYLQEHMAGADFLLAAYETENWNDAFSPWKAPAVFGKEGFGGAAGETLGWLTEYFIPYAESGDAGFVQEADRRLRFTVGYSLAGLFALWAYCEGSDFAGAVSSSGSLWFEGWLDYVQKNETAFCNDRTSYIYLSLGEKEEKTKNRKMSSVGDNTRAVYELLCKKQENVKCTLEWNSGGHFSEPDLRVAKGIYWILRTVRV